MVAHLLRLKLTLLRNSVRRSPWQLVGLGIGALYALGIVAVCVAGLFVLRGVEIELAQTVVVLGGATALLGWAVIPVAVSAADMTLDPARFTTFAVPMPQLLAGLALGGLIGIPGLATSLVALATVGTWSRSLPAAAGALVGCRAGRAELHRSLQGRDHGHGRTGKLPPLQGHQRRRLPHPARAHGAHRGGHREGNRRFRRFPDRPGPDPVLDAGRGGVLARRRAGRRQLRGRGA